MAILMKDLFVKDICNRVGRGAVYFDKGSRPQLEMGGQKVFVDSVAYDPSLGRMTYTVARADGTLALSKHGPRMLDTLDVRTLSSVSREVRKAESLRRTLSARKAASLKEPGVSEKKRPVMGVSM